MVCKIHDFDYAINDNQSDKSKVILVTVKAKTKQKMCPNIFTRPKRKKENSTCNSN
jgi:hypothetical protein